MYSRRVLRLLLWHHTYRQGFVTVSNKIAYLLRFHSLLLYFRSASHLARLISSVLTVSATSLALNFVAKLVFSDDAMSSNVVPAKLVTLSLTSLIILSLSFSEGTLRIQNILSTSTPNSKVPCCSSTPFLL